MDITMKKFGKYQGRWVAIDLSKERILASGEDFYVLAKKMEKTKKPKRWIMKYIIPFNVYLAPHAISI